MPRRLADGHPIHQVSSDRAFLHVDTVLLKRMNVLVFIEHAPVPVEYPIWAAGLDWRWQAVRGDGWLAGYFSRSSTCWPGTPDERVSRPVIGRSWSAVRKLRVSVNERGAVVGADAGADVTLADDESGIGYDRRRVMTREDDIAARERSDPAVSSGGQDDFDALVAPDAVDPGVAQGQVPGPAGGRGMLGELRIAVADSHIVALYLTAGQNAGAFACAVTGTHGGQLTGCPITGRAMTFRGVPDGRPQGGLLTGRRVAAASSGLRTQPGLGPQL